MRRIYLFFIAACTMLQSANVSAQETVTQISNGSMGNIPKSLTTENKPYIFTCTKEENIEKIKIYEKGFKVASEFNSDIEKIEHKKIIEEREAVSGVITREYYNSYDIVTMYENTTPSLPKIKRDTLSLDYQYHIWSMTFYDSYSKYLAYNYTYKTQSDSGAIYYPKYTQTTMDTIYYFKPDKYGNKYPKYIVRLNVGKDKYMCCHSRSYREGNRYIGEWKSREEIGYVSNNNILTTDFINIDNSEFMQELGIKFSQTLFNNDEKFEYLIPEYEEETYLTAEEDRDYDGIIDYKEYYTSYYNIKGYNIYSNGEKIGYLNIPITIRRFFVFGGETYISGYYENYEEEIYNEYIYRLNRSTNSVEQITEPTPVKITPKREYVNIEFKETTSEDCELIITSADGRLCKKSTIKAGSENTTYDTRALANGIYNFTIVQKDKIIENGKIVIR